MTLGAALAAPSLSALQAQTAVQRVLMERDESGTPPAQLWVVEAKSGLAAGFSALLGSPRLRVYQVPLRAIALDSAEGRGFLSGHGLAAEPQWVLLDARAGALLSRGATLPTGEALAQTLEQAGFRDRAKELQAFLKRDPGSLEAHELLLRVLRARGEEAAMRAMGMRVESPQERMDREGIEAGQKPQPPPDLSAAKPLGPVQDLEAWSAFAQEVDTVFRSGQWREMDLAWTREGRRIDSASPTLQGLYLRWMPVVEEALRADPSSEPLWNLWCWMSEATGSRRLRALLASVEPSPLTPRGEWPPETAVRLLLATAKTPEDWSALKIHYLAAWDEGSHPLLQGTVEKTTLPWEADWEECLGPLIQCCLRTGDTARAEAILRAVRDASRWSGLADAAAAVAAQCGQPALAARWKTLRAGAAR